LAAWQPYPHSLPWTPPPREQRSLFGEILDWMLAPLLLLWPMSVALTWLVAQSIANRPFDRELADWRAPCAPGGGGAGQRGAAQPHQLRAARGARPRCCAPTTPTRSTSRCWAARRVHRR
jgi:hypothetical protein